MSHESMYELRKRQLASCPGTSHVMLGRIAEDERRHCVGTRWDANFGHRPLSTTMGHFTTERDGRSRASSLAGQQQRMNRC